MSINVSAYTPIILAIQFFQITIETINNHNSNQNSFKTNQKSGY